MSSCFGRTVAREVPVGTSMLEVEMVPSCKVSIQFIDSKTRLYTYALPQESMNSPCHGPTKNKNGPNLTPSGTPGRLQRI